MEKVKMTRLVSFRDINGIAYLLSASDSDTYADLVKFGNYFFNTTLFVIESDERIF